VTTPRVESKFFDHGARRKRRRSGAPGVPPRRRPKSLMECLLPGARMIAAPLDYHRRRKGPSWKPGLSRGRPSGCSRFLRWRSRASPGARPVEDVARRCSVGVGGSDRRKE
jgi:hypothetical protein